MPKFQLERDKFRKDKNSALTLEIGPQTMRTTRNFSY